MNLRYFALMFLYLSQSTRAITPREFINIIKSDDVRSFEEKLNKSYDVNTEVNTYISEPIYTRAYCPMLCYALKNSANKIAQFLIHKSRTTIDLMARVDNKFEISALFFALQNDKISTETVKLLLENGANIETIYTKKSGNFLNSKFKSKSLFNCIYLIANKQKRKFIIYFLINIYGKDVLFKALVSKTPLPIIEELVAHGASIPEKIIAFANGCKVDSNIIKFLQRQFDINKTIIDSANCLPYGVADLIGSYCRGSQQTLQEFLIESILSNDINSINDYLQKGGNPNYIIKNSNSKYSLFLFALQSGSEEIASFLMDNGSDINTLGKSNHVYFSPLFVALKNKKISLNFVKKMLNNGADINNICAKRTKSKKQHYNLSYALFSIERISLEKLYFVFNYLLNGFGPNVLDFILDNETTFNFCDSLSIIKEFIARGAVVNRHIVEKAKKIGHLESTIKYFADDIIKYLNGILQLNEQLRMSNIKLPGYPKVLINDYYCIEESARKGASDKCIVG